ncbi:conserved hypothetical protein [Thiomonas sp. X19]|uniref:hypothetical protein n=1 Tax=Thiomonas sp. X19 TaxID=1050370 RepID=UPI000B7003EB|nr:hypothetical protein [Thiomonas sp. X19]SCC92433.1 conserved hypothetical protein [Thiomonas sp. X19]
MTKSKSPELRIVACDVLPPTPPRNRVRLHNIDDIRLEMGKVYNDMRDGTLEAGTGTKLAYVLGQMVRIYEVHEIERRTEALERAMKLQLPKAKP